MEIYYAIVNLLDYIALNSGDSIDDTLIDICYKLLPYLEGDNHSNRSHLVYIITFMDGTSIHIIGVKNIAKEVKKHLIGE